MNKNKNEKKTYWVSIGGGQYSLVEEGGVYVETVCSVEISRGRRVDVIYMDRSLVERELEELLNLVMREA